MRWTTHRCGCGPSRSALGASSWPGAGSGATGSSGRRPCCWMTTPRPDVPVAKAAILIHELVHVWQAQQGVNLALAKLKAGDRPDCYAYEIGEATTWYGLNIEQQAMAVEDEFRRRRAGAHRAGRGRERGVPRGSARSRPSARVRVCSGASASSPRGRRSRPCRRGGSVRVMPTFVAVLQRRLHAQHHQVRAAGLQVQPAVAPARPGRRPCACA